MQIINFKGAAKLILYSFSNNQKRILNYYYNIVIQEQSKDRRALLAPSTYNYEYFETNLYTKNFHIW